jgi:AcrR family transcriptional regulator
MDNLMHSNIQPVHAVERPADKVDISRRGSRRDGEVSRERILHTALRLFSAQGYKNTSTREIATEAQVNVAALNYYFGDKARLYRATFGVPEVLLNHANAPHDAQGFSRPGLPLGQAMHELFSEFLRPLASGEVFLWGLRLRYREMVEPTGVWQEQLDTVIEPMHAALRRLLCREFDRLRPDADVERLTFCIIGMAVHFIIGHPVVMHISPHLLHDKAAVQLLADRIATYACDMIHAEARRRESQA